LIRKSLEEEKGQHTFGGEGHVTETDGAKAIRTIVQARVIVPPLNREKREGQETTSCQKDLGLADWEMAKRKNSHL